MPERAARLDSSARDANNCAVGGEYGYQYGILSEDAFVALE